MDHPFEPPADAVEQTFDSKRYFVTDSVQLGPHSVVLAIMARGRCEVYVDGTLRRSQWDMTSFQERVAVEVAGTEVAWVVRSNLLWFSADRFIDGRLVASGLFRAACFRALKRLLLYVMIFLAAMVLTIVWRSWL